MGQTELTEDEYLKKCLELLDYFHKDYSGDVIKVSSGDLSCILNPRSKFYKLFGGYSIYDVVNFVAEKLNKKIEFID